MNTETDDKLMADAARLAKAVAPERDLWPAIEASINAPRERQPMPWYAQAAAVLLLVGGSSAVTYIVTKQETNVSPVATNGGLVLESASWGGEYEMSVDYKLARRGLREQLAEELERMSPEARVEVEQNLQVIRDAIAEINTALEAEPDNVHLQRLLLRTYREELAVMQHVGGLTQNVMSRNDI